MNTIKIPTGNEIGIGECTQNGIIKMIIHLPIAYLSIVHPICHKGRENCKMCIRDRNLLDQSVNRSLGVQIKNAIKDYPDGTIFGKFKIE